MSFIIWPRINKCLIRHHHYKPLVQTTCSHLQQHSSTTNNSSRSQNGILGNHRTSSIVGAHRSGSSIRRSSSSVGSISGLGTSVLGLIGRSSLRASGLGSGSIVVAVELVDASGNSDGHE